MSQRRLVGRDDELGDVVAFLEARHALPRALLVEGEAGIGKTALWLAALEAATERGYLVLSCRPSEAEARFSFSGLADLLDGVVSDVSAELPRPQRRALHVALGLSESDVHVDEGLLAFAFLNVLRRLARRSGVVVAVDDVQWLDIPSLALLGYALPRLDTEAVAMLVIARGRAPSWLRRGTFGERLLELELGPLSVGALHELLRARLDGSLPRPVLLRIWETSGGNPFFAIELARALQRRGERLRPSDDLPIPASLEELVHERLDGLGVAALEVARVVAALAEPTVPIVEGAAGRRVKRGLADALEARVLELDGEHLRFTHPLLRSAVYSRSTPPERRSLHARLAGLVSVPEERARHLGLAASRPTRETAAALEDAARAAHARGAPAAAAELAEQALRLTPASDVEGLQRRLLLAADRLDEAGDHGRAIALLEQASAAAQPGPARAAILAHLAQPAFTVRGPRAALSLCEEALAEAEGDDALTATIHLWLADLMRFVPGASTEHGLEQAELALAAAGRAADLELRCQALARFGLLHFVAGRGVPRVEMEEALALERSLGVPRLTHATWTIAHQLTWSGEDIERARRHLHEYRHTLRAREDLDEIEALWALSVVEWRAGNWDLAARYAADLLALAAQSGTEAEQPFWELARAAIAAHRGQIDEARAGAERALARAEQAGNRRAQAMHLWLLGFIQLSLGDPAAALEYLRPAWAIYDELGYFEPGHRLELADTFDALIAVGALDEAERLLGLWEKRARELDRAWVLAITARSRALLLAAKGDFAGAIAGFDRALAEHARSVNPFQHARTLLALGTVQRRSKRWAAARATLEHALTIFDELGASLWAKKARAELARIGGRRAAVGELTPTERRLAELVAEGRSNKEIAATLFVTPKTVGTKLSRMYAKLGVHSRTELIHRLAERPESKV